MRVFRKSRLVLSVMLLAGLFLPSAWAAGPAILLQPAPQTVVAGSDVTFAVGATGTGQLQYQWKKNGVDLEGETGATLTLENVTAADSGDYSVTVTDSLGAQTSNSAKLTVGVPELPSITLQPVSQEVDAGADVTLSVNAKGAAPLMYQWKKDGVDIDGATSATLTLNNVTEAEAGNYSVVVRNALGAATSANARLDVDATDAPVITLQPLSQTVPANGTIMLTVGATGDGQLSYQWKKNGVNLDGKTSASLTIPNAASADTGVYSVVVTDEDGATTSNNANVTVGVNLPPVITLQPGSQTVNAGSKVTFNSAATGSGDLRFQWNKNGAAIDGATSSSLTLSNVTASSAGDYTVTVSNDAGSQTSAVAKLTVNALLKPTITSQPTNQTVNVGGNATFSVNASGSGNLQYQWRKNGVDLEGETGATLTINGAAAADAGDYSVVVSNDAGAVASANARLTVNAQQQGPSITLQPLSQTVSAGGNATFTAQATGSGNLRFQWRKNGVALDGETGSTLTLNGVTAADAGDYSVVITDDNGSTTSASARLDVQGSVSDLIDLSFLTNNVSDITAFEAQADGKLLASGKIAGLLGVKEDGVARVNTDGSVDLTFNARANGKVRDLEWQSDGKVLVAGDFSTVNGSQQNGAARLNANGAVDSSFQTGAGANGPIESIELDSNGKVLLAGDFTAFNGTPRRGLVRLNADGSVDTSFDAGLNGGATDVDAQGDGKILVSGAFTSAGGSNRNGVARLNANGQLDSSFNAGAGSNVAGGVDEIELQGDGKILLAGDFDTFSGTDSPAVVRLNTDGSVDASFSSGLDASSDALTLEARDDGKVVVGGTLKAEGDQETSAVLLLNGDGSVNSSLDLGAEGPDQVAAIELQDDGKIVIGGVDGMARLNALFDLDGPEISGIVRNGNSLEISLPTQAGVNYVLETKASLSDPVWSPVANVSGDGSVRTFTDIATAGASGFFRVRAQ